MLAVARQRARVESAAQAIASIKNARGLADQAGGGPEPVYTVSPGIGLLATTRIDADRRSDLRHARLRSHASEMGHPVEVEVVRAMMFLRARTVCMGSSGPGTSFTDPGSTRQNVHA
ncbi:MAG TPA: aromatic amino acid lyase [Candidatus Dormibacteraeota bacterium]|nr:aromatic amino acid lyase [Candidatus Dormibacteraeota bacterium]